MGDPQMSRRSSHVRVLCVALLIGLALAGAVHLGGGTQGGKDERVLPKVSQPLPLQKGPLVDPSLVVERIGSRVEAPWSPTGRYNALRNGRVFVLDAVKHPEEGGAFYASWVADICRAVKDAAMLEQGQPDINQVGADALPLASRALNDLRARCDQFTDEELAALSGRTLSRSRLGAVDVLQSAANRFRKARDRQAKDSAAQSILELGDPLLIDRVGLWLLARHAPEGGFLFYDGQRFGLTESSGLAEAMYLLPCELGLSCGIEDPYLAMLCVSGAGCYGSRQERALMVFADNDPARMAEFKRLASSMAEAIRAKDYDKFIPPR